MNFKEIRHGNGSIAAMITGAGCLPHKLVFRAVT
jgi:hypothetical protein